MADFRPQLGATTQADAPRCISLLRRAAWPVALIILATGWFAIAPKDHLAAYVPADAPAYLHVRGSLPETLAPFFATLPTHAREYAAYAVPTESGLSWHLLSWSGRTARTADGSPAIAPSEAISAQPLRPWRYHFPVTGRLAPHLTEDISPTPGLLPASTPAYIGLRETPRGLAMAIAAEPSHSAGVTAFARLLLAKPAIDLTGITAYGSTTSMPLLRMLVPEWFVAADASGLSSTPAFIASLQELGTTLGRYPANLFTDGDRRILALQGADAEGISIAIATILGDLPVTQTLTLPDGSTTEEFVLPATPNALPTNAAHNSIVLTLPAASQVAPILRITQCSFGSLIEANPPTTPSSCGSSSIARHGRGLNFPLPTALSESFPQLRELHTVYIDQIVENFVTIVLK